jgi:hypothetical protein
VTEEALLDSKISSYRVPATTSGGRSAPAHQRNREEDGVGLALVNLKSPLCNRVPPRYVTAGRSSSTGSAQGGET